MIFTASDVSSLSQSLHRWEIAEYIFEGLVIVACGGELVADLGRKCLKRTHRDRIERISTVLLVAALSIELICLKRTNDLSGNVIGSLGNKAEEADSSAQKAVADSGSALTKAGEARLKVDGLVQQADALTVRMGTASAKLGELKHQIIVQGPRWRSLEQNKSAFLEALKPFKGQRVTVLKCGTVSPAEQEKLEQDLLNFFGTGGAGWEVGYAAWTTCTVGATSVGGNMVIVASTASDGVKDSAKALANILNTLEISTIRLESAPEARRLELDFLGSDSPWILAMNDPTTVFLLVGSNPMFDLAGMKKRHK